MKILYLLISLFIMITDQAVKHYLIPLLDHNNIIKVCSYFNLVGVWNTGISFGMFDNLRYSDIIFSFISILIILILIYYFFLLKEKVLRLGIVTIIGGAIGNMLDRIRFGAVFDFIDIHLLDYHWPAFNLADSYICLGVLILILKRGKTVIVVDSR